MFEKHEIKKLVKLADAVKDAYVNIPLEEFAKFMQNARVYLNEAEKQYKSGFPSKAFGYISEAEKQIKACWNKIHGWK